MPSFEEFFEKSKAQPIYYKGNKLFLADKFSISNGDRIVISIESTNSEYIQGVSIDIKGYCKVNDKIWKPA